MSTNPNSPKINNEPHDESDPTLPSTEMPDDLISRFINTIKLSKSHSETERTPEKLNLKLLKEIAEETVNIQKERENLRGIIEAKPDNDIVTEADKSNEEKIKELLKDKASKNQFSLAIFGEEFGQTELVEKPDYWVSLDPIDGTRGYAEERFYSAVTAGFRDETGEVVGGIIVSINNQIDESFGQNRYELYAVNKGSGVEKAVFKDGGWNWEPFKGKTNDRNIEKCSGDMTFVKSFLSQWREEDLPEAIEKYKDLQFALDMHSAGLGQNISGCSSILSVLNGRIGFFVNFCTDDTVSHDVAILIAKELKHPIEHIFTKGDSFAVEPNSTHPRYKGGDGTIVIAGNEEIRKIVNDEISKVDFPLPIGIDPNLKKQPYKSQA